MRGLAICYLGGKFKVRYQIAEYINGLSPKVYLEPFCGYCWVGERVRCPRRFFSDRSEHLIEMWSALQQGWKPPMELTEAEFKAIRERNEISPMRGFIETSCSFNGCFGCGFKDRIATGAKKLIRRTKSFRGATFRCCDYRTAMDESDADVVYCDPPYAGMYQLYYEGQEEFDTAGFWEEIRKRSDGKRRILVSEYDAPSDFTVVLTAHSRMGLTSRAQGKLDRHLRVERLFEYQPPKRRSMVSFGSLLEG